MITQRSVGSELFGRLRVLISSAVAICLLFSNVLVHAQTPQTPSTLKGESNQVLLVPNATVNAGEVRLKSDRDHDGMSDEAESANGTNPDDPADADSDADGDGLSNGDEVAIGSGVNNADSDGDGASDGEEARLGFNPNDATNTPPANATIVSIQVTPSPLELSRNTVIGPQPVRLRVNGTLNTGASVDLINAPETTYVSQNTSVALVDSFGTAAGVAIGSTTITVQNGSFTVQVPTTVSNYTPIGIAEIFIPGYANSVTVQGTRIAFDSYRDDPDVINEEIYVMNLNGTGLVRLTNNTADDFAPSWSPDGSKILFRSNRNGNYEIFIMNADGSDQHSLTGYSGDSSPVFSPDGTRILINSDRDGLGGFYVMNPDGTGITHVANTGTFGGNSDAFGSWSPDGTRIAFHSYRNGEADIFIVNADGSGLVNVTNHSSADFTPRWSPDGTKILFNSFRDGNSEFYVSNADGSGLVRLTNSLAHELGALWSPDGSQVVFTRFNNGDSSSIHIVNADGTGIRSLVSNGARNFALEWKIIP